MGAGRGGRVDLNTRSGLVRSVLEANKAGICVALACRELGLNKRTFERWRKKPNGDNRQGPLTAPANKLNENERKQIVKLANSPEYRDKSAAQIVPLLADKGLYIASEATFYRVLKAENLLAHRHRSKAATHSRPKALLATAPNHVYSWDITYLRSSIRGQFFYLYVFPDIYSRKIVGYTISEEQSAETASKLIDQICYDEGIPRNTLILHSGNGGPMKGATMLATLQKLGVVPSFSRPAVSDDNPFSESLFKTPKYCPEFPSKPFESLGKAFAWVNNFVGWYNNEHLHSGIKFVTPASRHSGDDIALLAKRDLVYREAKFNKPERWSKATRNWTHEREVSLNCLPKPERSSTTIAA